MHLTVLGARVAAPGKLLLLLVLSIGGSGLARAQDVGTSAALSLEEAVRVALEENPMVRSVRASGKGAGARYEQAKAARMPVLQFGETFTHSNNPVFVFGSLLEQGRFSSNNFDLNFLNSPPSISNFRSALNLKIPVFNRKEISGRIEQARLGTEVSELVVQQVEQQVRFQVIQAYYGILVAEARKRAADQAVETARAERKRIQDMVEQGMVVQSDLLATEVQLADFEKESIQAAGEVKTAYAALNTALGRSVDSQVSISGQLMERDFGIPDQALMIRDAEESRPDYLQARLEAEVHREELRISRGKFLPDLNLFANFGYSAQDLVTGSSDFAVGAALTFDILDLGRYPRNDEAEADWEAARLSSLQKANEISLEVVQALSVYEAAGQRLRVAATAVSQAEEALRIVRDRHGVGLATITEVLNSQTALLRSRMNLLGARYDYYVGYARTLLVTGKLDGVAPFVS